MPTVSPENSKFIYSHITCDFADAAKFCIYVFLSIFYCGFKKIR